jgi:predicted MFS family arabinose efflux permease
MPRAFYVLAILALVTALNYYDRNLISILVEDLKRDLHFSDTQIGLLTGLAFAVVYSVVSLPVARWADGGHRIRVLSAALLVWSVMTGLCGAATGFWTMLAGRFGVGIGEAGGAPTTHAVVAETFAPSWRGSALAIIALAGAIGYMAAISLGGWLAAHHGWRIAFLAAAGPGALLALLLYVTVREPGRGNGRASELSLPLSVALPILARRPAFVWSCIATAVMGLGAFSTAAWTPAYLMRQFHLDAGEVGISYGAAVGPAMLFGVLAGGVLGDWLGRRGDRLPFYFMAATFFVTTPLAIGYVVVSDYGVALALVVPMTFVSSMFTSPIYAAVQALSGPRLRATGAATFMLIANLVGQGLGPLLTGWLSDQFSQAYGSEGLRYALLAGASTYLLGALAYLMAARTAAADIADANEAWRS